ncbi:uncharacterized protein [Ambystoma mexicanum]|uniref:uncharacterized protein n=1 Tax=Ambystoma mexicanum TaxID=8296 RepID=UPI0037E85405
MESLKVREAFPTSSLWKSEHLATMEPLEALGTQVGARPMSEKVGHLTISGSLYKRAFQDTLPKNDQEHEESSFMSKCSFRGSPGAPRIPESEFPIGDVHNRDLLATLQRLEAKMDHLQNTMEVMPSKVEGIMRHIWRTNGQEFLKKGVAIVDMVSPASGSDCIGSSFPTLTVSTREPGPCLQPEPDQLQNHCLQPVLTDEQGQQKQCIGPVFTHGQCQPNKGRTPAFPGNKVEQTAPTQTMCSGQQHLGLVVTGGRGQSHNRCTNSPFSNTPKPDTNLKLEPLCLQERGQEEYRVTQQVFPGDPGPHWNFSHEQLCTNRQSDNLEPLFPVRQNPQQNLKVEPLSPGQVPDQKSNPHGPLDTFPPLASDSLPSDGAGFIDSVGILEATPDILLLNATTAGDGPKTKRLLLNPRTRPFPRRTHTSMEGGQDQSSEMENKWAHSQDGQTPFTCTEYGESTTDPSSFLRHQECHIKGRPQACMYCEKSFTEHSQLLAHVRIHMNEKAFACTVCGKCCSSQSSLIIHKRLHMSERRYKSTEFEKSFTHPSHASQHQKIPAGEEVAFKCKECGQYFRLIAHLNVHKRSHMGERPYQCTLCKKTFINRYHLRTHQRIHTGERPFQCRLCDKNFTQSSNLFSHQRIHSGEKPYKCLECGKQFRRTTHLSQHRRIHSGEKPYRCTECGKHFTDLSNLRRHERCHLEELARGGPNSLEPL